VLSPGSPGPQSPPLYETALPPLVYSVGYSDVGAGFMPARPNGVRLFQGRTCACRRTRPAKAGAYIQSNR
jgi:hypothetical protein